MISATAFRELLAVADPSIVLSEMRTITDDLKKWYQALPEDAKADQLSSSDAATTSAIYYIHLQHLSAVLLVYRRALSVFSGLEARERLSDVEREQLTLVLNEGVLAAKQATRVLFLIVAEGRALRHCWTVM